MLRVNIHICANFFYNTIGSMIHLTQSSTDFDTGSEHEKTERRECGRNQGASGHFRLRSAVFEWRGACTEAFQGEEGALARHIRRSPRRVLLRKERRPRDNGGSTRNSRIICERLIKVRPS